MAGKPRRVRRKAVLRVIAGTTGLALSTWGAAASAAPAKLTAPSVVTTVSRSPFCDDVSAAMVRLAGPDPTTTMTLAQARYTLDSLLNIGIRNFAALETKAPASLRYLITLIVADFRNYEAQTMKATSVKQLLDSTAQANPVDMHPYQQLVSYTATSC